MTCVPKRPNNLRRQIIRPTSTRRLPNRIKADRLKGHCGGFPSTCPLPNQNPLVRPREVDDPSEINLSEPKQTPFGTRGKRFPSFWVPNEMDRPNQLRFPNGLTNIAIYSKH